MENKASKNLFDYATKELSQDAFLRYVLESFNDPEIGHISRELIGRLISLDGKKVIDVNRITDVKTFSQVEKMDIVADVIVDGKKYVIIIEDKTSSSQHDKQLERYKEIVKGWKDLDLELTSFVFYKTDYVYDYEINEINNAGWSLFKFDDIYEFWKEYVDCPNIIVSQYSKHIEMVWNKTKNDKKPLNKDKEAWAYYFINTIEPRLDKTKLSIWCGKTRYRYSIIQIKPKEYSDKHVPYLEIRNNDCFNDKFVSKILFYDVPKDENNLPFGLMFFRSYIKNNSKLFNPHESSTQLKQAGNSKKITNIKTDEQFIECVNNALREYLKIFEEWKRDSTFEEFKHTLEQAHAMCY